MLNLSTISVIFCIAVPLIFLLLKPKSNADSSSTKLPRSYPIFGSIFSLLKNRERFIKWTSDIVISTPSLTFPLRGKFGRIHVVTANPAVVQHILKSHFDNYHKGNFFKDNFKDLLGDGILNSDGENWKFQRQVASHEFNAKSLRKFVEVVVDSEIFGRLIPVLENAAEKNAVLDFQDILTRLAFDNICKIAFGYDPGCLSPSLPQDKVAVAFETAFKISSERMVTFTPYARKIKRALNIGSEKELKIAVSQIREFATKIVREKKQEIQEKPALDHSAQDLLSRFLSTGHSDEEFVTDIVISFILAGRESTSTALAWFFWLLSNHPGVENEILREIKGRPEAASGYDEVKEMIYTHASLCESMRLYPPIAINVKQALNDDVLPDGTQVKKGTKVIYHPYAMGRVEKVWGKDWAAFRPERWLERDSTADKWGFVNRDAYTYPVFQAGPRICLGKDMAFIQMKRVVAAVLQRFRVVPASTVSAEPEFISNMSTQMKGGFPVRIEERAAGKK